MLKRKKVCACHLEVGFKVDPRNSEEASVRRCMHLRLFAARTCARCGHYSRRIHKQKNTSSPKTSTGCRCSGVQLCSICRCRSPSKTVFMELCANFAAQMSHGQAVLVEAKPNAHAEIVLESWGRNILQQAGNLGAIDCVVGRHHCRQLCSCIHLHPMLRLS